MPNPLHRSLSVTLALLAFSAPQASAFDVAPASPTPTPLLWSGQVVDRTGTPVAAEVIAFLRPPASAIPIDGQGEALPSIPLTSTKADRSGRFELRSTAPAIPDLYRPDGWLHLMVLATTPDGSSALANDSVRWIAPQSRLAGGAWVSTFLGEEQLRSALAARRSSDALAVLAAEDMTDGLERPPVLQLGEPSPTTFRAQGASDRWTGPGAPYLGCSAMAVEDRQEAFRTISDIDVGPAWSYELDYTDTKTTAWDIGVEQSGGGWKAGGTTSFSNTLDAGFNADYGPYPSRFREAFQVQLVHAKVLWRCASQNSPGPFYIRTVEPERWTGGTYNQGDPVVPCNRGHREPVAGHAKGFRHEGRTSKYSAAAAVFGFSGQAAVTYSRYIKLGWKNHLDHARDVCGESDHPYRGRTRVAAMDEHQ